MSENKPLNFDLDSLDENSQEFEAERKKLAKIVDAQQAKASSISPNNTWIIILAVVAVFGLIVWIAMSNSSSSDTSNSGSSGSSSSSTYNTQVGNYQCTSSDASTANLMEPSSVEKAAIEAEGNRLNDVGTKLKAAKAIIDNYYINDYSSQSQINSYNSAVDTYNAAQTRAKADYAAYSTRYDAYQNKVNAYNSFLSSHCK